MEYFDGFLQKENSKNETKGGKHRKKLSGADRELWNSIMFGRDPRGICEIANIPYERTKYIIVCEKIKGRLKSNSKKDKIHYNYNPPKVNKIFVLRVWEDLFQEYYKKDPFRVCRFINKHFIDPGWRLVPKYKKLSCRMKPAYKRNNSCCSCAR